MENHKVVNEHGLVEFVDEEGSPVCSNCGCAVMPNRGQGTLCGECGADFDRECAADYDFNGGFTSEKIMEKATEEEKFELKHEDFAQLPDRTKCLLDSVDRRGHARTEMQRAQAAYNFMGYELTSAHSQHTIFANEVTASGIHQLQDLGRWTNLKQVAAHAIEAACNVLKDRISQDEKVDAQANVRMEQEMLEFYELKKQFLQASVADYREFAAKLLKLADQQDYEDWTAPAPFILTDANFSYAAWGRNLARIGKTRDEVESILGGYSEPYRASIQANAEVLRTAYSEYLFCPLGRELESVIKSKVEISPSQNSTWVPFDLQEARRLGSARVVGRPDKRFYRLRFNDPLSGEVCGIFDSKARMFIRLDDRIFFPEFELPYHDLGDQPTIEELTRLIAALQAM